MSAGLQYRQSRVRLLTPPRVLRDPRQPRGAGNGQTGVPRRPSLRGGKRAKDRDLGVQGLQTLKRLLDAGLAEFCDKGYQAVRVEDVVHRAKTSHGTFYLYFESKDDLFATLLRDVLEDMRTLADDFPVVTTNDVGRAALRAWVGQFCRTYAAHAAVIRIVSQAEIVSEEVWRAGLAVLQYLARSIALGMTAAQRSGHAPNSGQPDWSDLTAVACVTMLERVNYLISMGVQFPTEDLAERVTGIIVAAFRES